MQMTMQKKIAITIDENLLAQIDYLVNKSVYPNRSRAIEAAIAEKIEDYRRKRFEMECANLDPTEEQEFAELGGFNDWMEKY
jgi:metal-responsive CopG/Arc/MetJ family transcriptional regulator